MRFHRRLRSPDRPVLPLALLLALAASCATGQRPRAVPRRFVIDSHQHFQNQPDYIQRLVATYRPRNAMACVLTPPAGLETMRRAALEHPDVVIPYGRIDVDAPDAAEQIRKFADAGWRGIKMHSPRRNWDDPQYMPLYQLLLERKMVALFHTGIGSHGSEPQQTSMARMRPAYLDTIIRAYPNLVVQGAHLGNPWYEEAAEAARWAPNLYFDLTGSSMLKKQDDLRFWKRVLWWEGPSQHTAATAVYAFEKLVFGTDEPPEHFDKVLAQFEAVLDACDVPEPSRRKIYGETMARILGITRR